MPCSQEPLGIREKLLDYCLDPAHQDGGPKARGFESILGIEAADVDYLETTIRDGILSTPVSQVRDNYPHGLNCVVDLAIAGLREKSGRIIAVRTIWELVGPGVPPRLVTAYPRP